MIADIPASDEIDAAAAHGLDRLLARCAIRTDHLLLESIGQGLSVEEAMARLEAIGPVDTDRDPVLF